MNTSSNTILSCCRALGITFSLLVTSAYAQKVEGCVRLSDGFGGSETTSPNTTRKIFSILACDSQVNKKIIDNLGDRLGNNSDLGIYFLTSDAYLILELPYKKKGFIVGIRGQNAKYIPFSNTGADDLSSILSIARETLEKNMPPTYQMSTSEPLKLKMTPGIHISI